MARKVAKKVPPLSPDERDLQGKTRKLGLYGILAHWDEYGKKPWLPALLQIEEDERARRSLERRRQTAKLTQFKSMADFNWSWPKSIDREQIEDIMRLSFLDEAANVLLVGPNGIGKTMIAKNIANAAILAGKRVRFGTAAEILNDLAAQQTPGSLERQLRRYVNPDLLVLDELGYLSTSADHADLLFQLINRRYEERSTIITTNKPFEDWGQVFPNAACISTMLDRLIHRSELVVLKGNSFRYHEAQERKKQQQSARRKTSGQKKK